MIPTQSQTSLLFLLSINIYLGNYFYHHNLFYLKTLDLNIIFIIMHNECSVEAWTNREEHPSSQQQEERDYSQEIESRLKIYELNSKVNQANLKLQKMSLQFQNDINEEKIHISQLEAEKDQLNSQYSELIEEYRKIVTIAEAEKIAKKMSYNQQMRLREILITVCKLVGLTQQDNQQLLEAIQNIKAKQTQREITIKTLNLEIITLKTLAQQNFEVEKSELKQKIAFIERQAQGKIKQLSVEGDQLKRLLVHRGEVIKQQSKFIERLQKIEAEFIHQTRQLEDYRLTNDSKEVEISKLRTKQELWNICKQRAQEEKLRYNEQAEQLKIQLELSGKKIFMLQSKNKQEESKSQILCELIVNLKHKINQKQQRCIELHGQISQLKKQLHFYEIYKEKFKKSQTQKIEANERASQFVSMAEKYAEQISHLQQSIDKLERQNQELLSNRQNQLARLHKMDQECAKANLMLNHQNEVIKEKKAQIIDLKREVSLANKELLAGNQPSVCQCKRGKTGSSTAQDVIEHYEKLLKEEDKNRKQIQQQLEHSRKVIFQLKYTLSKTHRQLFEIKQKNEIIQQERERLSKKVSDMQYQQENRINCLEQRYKQIEAINYQTWKSKEGNKQIND